MSILNRGHARHGVVAPKIAPISGRYYGHRDAYGGLAASTVGLSANFLYALPFWTPTTFTANQIALNITVAATAGKLIRLGVYSATAAGLPDALLVDSGALAADTAAPFVASATISQVFAAGVLYFLTAVTDGGPTVTSGPSVAASFGHADATGATALAGILRAFTYDALPATWGTPAYGTSHPHICVRAT